MPPSPSRSRGPSCASVRHTLGMLALLLPFLACHARPIPLSVQAGSTVVIPVGGGFPTVDLVSPVGFGGTDVADPQRGSFVFRLGGPLGFELITRAAFEVKPSDRARTPGQQILAVVDVPANAPIGSHALHLSLRREANGASVELPVSPGYEGGLTILPHEITIDLPGGGTETVVGTPTPAEDYRLAPGGGALGWLPSTPGQAVPRPGLRVFVLSPGRDPLENRWTAGAIVDVAYPEDTIEIASVVPVDPLKDSYWWEPRGPGRIRVYGTAMQATELSPFWVVFELIDPARPLDRASFSASLVTAADQLGSDDIVAAWQVTAGVGEIR